MRPYGEKTTYSDRGVTKRMWIPGGSYDVGPSEKARMRRRPRKRARQEGKLVIEEMMRLSDRRGSALKCQ